MTAIFVGRELSALVKANANKGILGNNTLRAVFREAVIRQLDLGVSQSLGCRWMLMTPAPPSSSPLRGSKPGFFSAQNTRPDYSRLCCSPRASFPPIPAGLAGGTRGARGCSPTLGPHPRTARASSYHTSVP